MRKILPLFLLIFACQSDYGNLTYVTKLPKLLEEVSGIQYDSKRNAFWMLNDSGNKSSIYLVSEKGKILKEVKINSDNKDWEDITQDKEGNVYVGDFGNNKNKRKDLHILKINHQKLSNKGKQDVEKIAFYYPEQKKFPPKKKQMYYDTEAFFVWNNHFYIFTKSRVKGKYGKTFLYQVPNKPGNHKALLIDDFETHGEGWNCSITGADISSDGKKVALITHQALWVFSDFKNNKFLSADNKEYSFNYISQKESVSFKNNLSVFIADEESKLEGRNLYELSLKSKP